MIQFYNQRNPAWADIHLGDSPVTIGKDGCLETAQCILASAFNTLVTPDVVAKHTECFNAQGEYLWNFPYFPFVLEKRIDGRNDAEIMKSLKDPKRCVVLQVFNGKHFVAALSRNWLGTYTVADPYYGDKCNPIKRWHNITGSRHLVLK